MTKYAGATLSKTHWIFLTQKAFDFLDNKRYPGRPKGSLNKKGRKNAVDSIKEICRDIGCSRMSSSCDRAPQHCNIVRKLLPATIEELKK